MTARLVKDGSDWHLYPGAAATPVVKVTAAGVDVLGALLVTGALNAYDFLLTNIPVGLGTNYAVTYSGGLVTLETWTRTALNKLWKSIAYTYTGSLVETEVTKVFDVDGTTILAQTTQTYSYTDGILQGSTIVRNI